MNIVAITPPLMIHYLQTLNTKFNTERIITTNDENDKMYKQVDEVINDVVTSDISDNKQA